MIKKIIYKNYKKFINLVLFLLISVVFQHQTHKTI